MKIFIGADHGGYHLKEKIEAYLTKRGYDWEDVGGKEFDPNDDFPQFAQIAATRVLGEDESTDPRAILICTGGQGMAMVLGRLSSGIVLRQRSVETIIIPMFCVCLHAFLTPRVTT